MTAHAGAQFVDLSRHRQRHTLVSETTFQACGSSLFQMSGAPFQQWTYLSDGRPINARSHTSDEDSSGQTSVSNRPYLGRESSRFHFQLPVTQNNEPTTMQNVGYTRTFAPGRLWDSGNDPKYRLPSTTTGSLAQYSIQSPAMSRNVEYTGPPSSYYDASSRNRGSVGSVGRINDVDSQYSSSSATFPSPVHSDKSPRMYPTLAPPANYQLPLHQRHNTASMPSGFENLLHHPPTPSPPPQPRTSSAPRYRLYIRQQPIAARACGAGDRDRRPVDPPPIVQMLLMDSDSGSEEGRSILQDPRLTVGCLLYPVQDSSWLGSSNTSDENTNLGINLEDSNAPGQSTPLLSGKAFVSPFYVDEEPDPKTAPPPPQSQSHLSSHNQAPEPKTLAHKPLGSSPPPRPPASFFIFSDLSVRTAGLYRLQFRLMNWGSVEDTGQSMPILAEAWSEPFRVYPAKDFPGMRDSSDLTMRLKELGFVELKTRGKGIGKGRRVGKGEAKS
ncbi:velvet factor-domain-containing protein [Aspergillus spectabilis]